jgi:hypothetical protein
MTEQGLAVSDDNSTIAYSWNDIRYSSSSGAKIIISVDSDRTVKANIDVINGGTPVTSKNIESNYLNDIKQTIQELEERIKALEAK